MSENKLINNKIENTVKSIIPTDKSFLPKVKHKIDFKTKPLGALGKIEDIAVQISMIQNTLNPEITNKQMLVFAGDHGITEEGVSAFPSEVTEQMVFNFLAGGAAINVFCNDLDIDMSVIDMGVMADFKASELLINKKVAKGTRNFSKENAMSIEEAKKSIYNGMELFEEKYSKKKIDIIGVGEMGIGNTTSASAIISTVTKKSIESVVGRGTGIDDKQLEHKIEVLKKSLAFHNLNTNDPVEILSAIGGYEIGGMCGSILSAASKKVPVVLDGIISTTAGLLAYLFNNDIRDYLIAGHKSVEQGHIAALEYMGITPVLDLGLRLGEGTGSALTIGIVKSSCKIMCEMASFEQAGVSNKN